MASYVTHLEKQLDEERSARKKLETELDEIKRLVTTLVKNTNAQA